MDARTTGHRSAPSPLLRLRPARERPYTPFLFPLPARSPPRSGDRGLMSKPTHKPPPAQARPPGPDAPAAGAHKKLIDDDVLHVPKGVSRPTFLFLDRKSVV